MNNTINHVSDSAEYVLFDPTGSAFPNNITNVQAALAALQGNAVSGVQNATTTDPGVIAIATQDEVNQGQVENKAVTPKTLEVRLQRPDATKTQKGVVRYGTTAEVMDASNESVAIAPDTLDHYRKNKKATEAEPGSIALATLEAARAGADDTTAVTPKKMRVAVSELVSGLIPEHNTATESRDGLVRLATASQTLDGTIREGFSISPYAFANANGNETKAGTFRVATARHMQSGTDDTVVVTAKKFVDTKASNTQFGTVKLVSQVGNHPNCALAANADVVPKSGGILTGDIYKGSQTPANKFVTASEVGLGVGYMAMVAFNKDDGNYYICNGRSLRKSEYPELFSKIGYTYGGSGDNFNIPDCRGVTVRGFDSGRGLDNGRQFGSYQEDTLQNIKGDIGPIAEDFRWSNWNSDSALFRNGTQGSDVTPRHTDWNECGRLSFDASRSARTSHETRMKNIALNYVIKVR